MARRPVNALFYAINGRGLGHLTRLLAVARATRELCDALGVPSELEFVTTSEASFICDDFPVYKLPSKTTVARSQLQRDRYAQRAKLIVSNLVAAKAPDLLVLDTVPYGAFQEFAFLRSYARASAYLYRHQDESSASSDLVQRHLELFDRIIVPDDESQEERYPLSRVAKSRVSFVGPIHSFDASTAWEAARVRAYFGVPLGKRLIYVSAGGGGDGRPWLEAVIEAVAADPANFVLAGYGPLHRGERRYAPNVVPLAEPSASRYFRGVDAAISAAGYNSYQELLAAGVPTLFFAQQKGLDRQDLRIARGVELGLHGEIAEHASSDLVLARLEDLLTGDERNKTVLALRARPDTRGALRAAVALLSICASLEPSHLERASLLEAAEARRATSPGSSASFVASFQAYRSFRTLTATGPDVAAEQDAAARGWWANGPASGEALRVGEALIAVRGALGANDDTWRALLRALASATGGARLVGAGAWLDALQTLAAHRHEVLERAAAAQSSGELLQTLNELRAKADAASSDDNEMAVEA